jgi:hypothetical protein
LEKRKELSASTLATVTISFPLATSSTLCVNEAEETLNKEITTKDSV